MTSTLRSCPRCQLVFEGEFICPTCHVDIREPTSDGEKTNERLPTIKVPIIRPK